MMERIARRMPCEASIAAVVCVCGMIVLGGCGSTHTAGAGSTLTASTRLSVGAAGKNPVFVACMRRSGITVLSDGELRAAKTVTPSQLNNAERECGFGVSTAAEQRKRLEQKQLERRSEKEVARRTHHTKAFKRLYATLVACLKRGGIHVSPTGAIGIQDAHDTRLRVIARRCREQVLGASSG